MISKGDEKGQFDRESLLKKAGITPEVMARAVRKSWKAKLEALKAEKRGFGSDKLIPDHAVRADAAVMIDRMAGVLAPRSEQAVTITHKVELPAWCQPDGMVRVIDVQESVVREPGALPAPREQG